MKHRQLWFSWFLVSLFFLAHYLFRVAPSVLDKELIDHFSITVANSTLMTSCFLLPYTFAQLPVGYALGVFPMKRLLAFAIFMSALGVAIFGLAPIFPVACIGQVIFGSFAAFAFVGSISYANRTLPHEALPLVVGLTQTFGMFAGFIAKNLIVNLTAYFTWQQIVLGISAILAILAKCVALFVPEVMPVSTNKNTDTAEVQESSTAIFWKKETWFNSLYAGLIFLPMLMIENYGEKALFSIHSYELKQITLCTSMSYVGWVIGGPLVGQFADCYGRIKVMKFAAITNFILCALIFYVQQPLWSLGLCLFLFGLTNTGLIACYTVAAEMYDESKSSLSVATSNMLTILLGAVIIPILGAYLEGTSNPIIRGSDLIYSAADMQRTFGLVTIAPLLALVCAWLTPETKKH